MPEGSPLPCREYLEIVVMQSPPERPVYLLGESFGGVLALAVAESRPDLVSANFWRSLLYYMQNAPSAKPHSNSSHPDELTLNSPQDGGRFQGCWMYVPVKYVSCSLLLRSLLSAGGQSGAGKSSHILRRLSLACPGAVAAPSTQGKCGT